MDPIAPADPRLLGLHDWLRRQLPAPFTVRPASNDASFRRYFRVRSEDRSWIAMDAPPEREPVGPFLAVARVLRGLELNAPRIHAADVARGYLLLDDLGSTSYLDALGEDNVDALYGDALAALATLQEAHVPRDLRPYDRTLIEDELRLFPQWLLGEHLGLRLDPAEQTLLHAVFDELVRNMLTQPRSWVHRDYHSRNLMVTPERNPGILDFQDAVEGPVTYDLVSLVKDCYIAWPRYRIEAWARAHLRRLQECGRVGPQVSGEQFLRWMDLTGMQRHIKVLGIFARLHHRDGRDGYLKDLPLVLAYVLDVCGRYPEFRQFGALLERRVTPHIRPPRLP